MAELQIQTLAVNATHAYSTLEAMTQRPALHRLYDIYCGANDLNLNLVFARLRAVGVQRNPTSTSTVDVVNYDAEDTALRVRGMLSHISKFNIEETSGRAEAALGDVLAVPGGGDLSDAAGGMSDFNDAIADAICIVVFGNVSQGQDGASHPMRSTLNVSELTRDTRAVANDLGTGAYGSSSNLLQNFHSKVAVTGGDFLVESTEAVASLDHNADGNPKPTSQTEDSGSWVKDVVRNLYTYTYQMDRAGADMGIGNNVGQLRNFDTFQSPLTGEHDSVPGQTLADDTDMDGNYNMTTLVAPRYAAAGDASAASGEELDDDEARYMPIFQQGDRLVLSIAITVTGAPTPDEDQDAQDGTIFGFRLRAGDYPSATVTGSATDRSGVYAADITKKYTDVASAPSHYDSLMTNATIDAAYWHAGNTGITQAAGGGATSEAFSVSTNGTAYSGTDIQMMNSGYQNDGGLLSSIADVIVAATANTLADLPHGATNDDFVAVTSDITITNTADASIIGTLTTGDFVRFSLTNFWIRKTTGGGALAGTLQNKTVTLSAGGGAAGGGGGGDAGAAPVNLSGITITNSVKSAENAFAELYLMISPMELVDIGAAAATGATFTISASAGGSVSSYPDWTWNAAEERFETTTAAAAAQLHFFDARFEGTTATIVQE